MKKRTSSRGGIRWLALVIVFSAGACGDQGASGSDGAPASEIRVPATQETFARVINVETSGVEPREFPVTFQSTGVVQAYRDATVSAEESGAVRRVVLDKGVRVAAGQTILVIDDELLVVEARAAEARAELARETWERTKQLFEEDNVGTELAYLTARSQVEQAQAALDGLRKRIERTRVRAPFAGVLDDRFVELGETVAQGTPVVRIVQSDRLKIVAGVPERYALDIRPGALARIAFDALPDTAFEGVISFVALALDPASRTFRIEIELENPGGAIKPEMIAVAEITMRTIEDAIVIPRNAVVTTEAGSIAFVVDDDGGEPRVEARAVRILSVQGNDAIIAEGLTGGDEVVVSGQQELANGDRVRIVAASGGGRETP